MRPILAWGLLLMTAAATATVFLLSPPTCVAVAGATVVAMRGRQAFVLTAGAGIALNALLLSLLLAGPGLDLGPLVLSQRGARIGAIGALRLATALGVNLVLLTRTQPVALLDGLRLPPRATGFLAAVLVAVADLQQSAGALRDAALLDGRWPRSRWRRLAAAAHLLPPLVLLAVQHGHDRAAALRLAGHQHGPRLAVLIGFTALAIAGRMALLAVPNDPATFAAVFLAGVVAGPRIGAAAGALAMAFSNLLLSGLLPVAFANVPAMAVIGLIGGALGRIPLREETRRAMMALAAACGALAVLLFSVLADAATWLLVPEYRGDVAALRALVAAGLAFNVLPAAAAAVVFALAIGPVAHAVQAGVEARVLPALRWTRDMPGPIRRR